MACDQETRFRNHLHTEAEKLILAISQMIFSDAFFVSRIFFCEMNLNGILFKGTINNKPSCIQMMARWRLGDKALSVAMLAWLADICMRHSASVNKVYN